MKKVRIALIAALVFLVSTLCFCLFASAATTVGVRLSDVNVVEGGTFTVDVSLVRNPGICATRFLLDYNTDAMRPVGVSFTSVLGGAYQNVNLAKAPLLLLWNQGIKNDTGTGVIAKVTFQTVSGFVGPADISLICESADDTLDTSFHTYMVEGTGGQVTIFPQKEFDFNRDRTVSNADITLLIQHLSGYTVPENDYDVDKNGKVNNRDAIRLICLIALADDPTEVVLPQQNGLVFTNSSSGIYNYCPTVMQMEDGTRYVYYCTNRQSYRVIDYIGCRKGTPDGNGGYTWGSESLVLSPSAGMWDAQHNCDPSVIAGNFRYNGETYRYLMAYLGCTSTNSQDNKIGLAVAKSPEGPFVKIGTQPFIDFERDMTIDQSIFQWGVGQPSLVSIDKGGKVWLFYTRGDKNGTRTMLEHWDLSDLNAPKKERDTVKLSATGLRNLNNGSDFMNNADFAFDAKNQVFYSSSDCHPNPTNEPDYISSDFRVSSFDYSGNFTTFTWKNNAVVGTSQTGYARNHNTGLVRDAYGYLPSSDVLTVYYTISVTGSSCLWSYRIHEYHLDISK